MTSVKFITRTDGGESDLPTALAAVSASGGDAAVAALGQSRTTTTLAPYLAHGAVFNVRDYGATGDGVTDDTAAINAALAAAAAVSGTTTGGARVHFTRGVYLVKRNNAAHNITGHNIRITGEGRGTIIQNGLTMSGLGSELYNAFSGSGKFGIVIENLSVVGFSVCNILSSTDVTIRGVHAYGYRNSDFHDKAVNVYGCKRIRISGCDFQDYNTHVFLNGATGTRCQDVTISGNTFINDAAAGTFTAAFPVGVYAFFADDVVVSGNTFRNIYSATDNGSAGLGMGYGVYESDGACAALTVSGNTFTYTGNGSKRATAIYVNYSLSATVTGNTIRTTTGANLYRGIWSSMKSALSRHSVVGNTIDATGIVTTASEARAIYANNETTSSQGAFLIADNNVYGGRIWVDFTAANTPNVATKITGNVVDGCPLGAGAIRVSAAVGTPCVAPDVSRNTVRNAAGTGILLAAAYRATVSGNQIQDGNTANGADAVNDLSGIVFTDISYGGLVTENTITNRPGGAGHLQYGVNFFASAQVFKFAYDRNLAFGLGSTGALYHLGYTAAPTGGWDWDVGDLALNASLAAGGPIGWYCVNRVAPTLTADATAGATTLTLASTTGLAAGDVVFLWTNASTIDTDAGDATKYHITTIASVDSGTQVTLTDAIPVGESYPSATAAVRAMRWQQGPNIGPAVLTSTQVTGLTGAADTTLHFHAADRARANHTGTQALSTITGGTATGSGYTLPDLTVSGALTATLPESSVTPVALYDAGNSATAITLTYTAARPRQKVTLTGNATITLASIPAGGSLEVHVNTGAGGFTGTFAVSGLGTLRWFGGSAPTVTATASKRDVYVFEYDGTDTFGAIIGQGA